MRKTLSILLSLLMVLSTVTCLFTMPASAEEATTETTVETLPVNDFITNNAVKTIKPDTVVKILDTEFPTSANYGINGWNDVQSDSYIDKNVYYQMTFDVTVSEDINDGVTLRPVFHSNADMNQTFMGIVGMRTDVTTPTVVETAYNLKTNVTSTGSPTSPTTTAANAATLVAGKTYTYTYVFNTYVSAINNIRMMAEGLTAGSVTVGEVKLFPRSETFANNFYFTTSVVSYDVEEDGNVFTRMYAYRDIGNTSTGHKTLSAKVGGELYNINLEGGKTYQLKFDARYKSEKGFHNSDTSGRSPGFNFYETGALLYNTAYASIRNEADTSFSYDKESAKTTSQRSYLGGTNAYSYFYADSGSTTINRRIKNNIANMSYYNADGTIINTRTQGYGSQSGRNFTDEINTGSWIKGVYSLDAIGEQSLQEAAIAGSASDNDAYMRYRYKNGAWVFNSAVNSYYAPAAQDVTVALGIEYLQAGSAYDFDNFELVSVVYDCNGNHSYDGLTDTECNICGEAKVYPTAWDFEDGNTENIGYTAAAAEVTVEDAINQPTKIGSKYLEYKTTDWGGMVFSFPYEQGYKYKISYDFKVFTFGGDDYVDADGYYQINANGLDHTIAKDADGIYNDNSYLATDTSAKIFTVTRYTEDGAVLNSEYFSNKKTNFYGRKATATGKTANDKNGNANELKEYGEFAVDPEVWETWQHFEVEIDHTATDYEGLIEYGFRPNGSGWVVGIDNFKAEKVSTETLNKVNTATNGTYAFNIRKQTAEKKQGLRFKSTIDLSASVAGEYTIVEYGTLAAKSTVLGKNGVLTLEMAEANKAVKGVAYNKTNGTDIRYAEEGNIITYTGVLTGIGVKNYDVDFTVRAYAIVETADGTRITVYDDLITLSVYKAALAIADPAVEEKEEGDKDIANEIIDAYYAYLDSAEQ